MQKKAQAMVMASLVADSLALGVHWIYDTEELAAKVGRVESLLKPDKDSFHPSKDKGDFTHYGDQTFVLLHSIAECKTFELQDFARRWQKFFIDYPGYVDYATKETLNNFSSAKSPEQSGSSSNDLAGASRIAPVVYCLRDNPQQCISAVRSQTMMTHTDPDTLDASEFFARVILCVLDGKAPESAIRWTAVEYFSKSRLFRWAEKGIDSQDIDSVPAVSGFGMDCHTPHAFPAVIHLIVRHQNNLKEALINNVMAGGDSAARGMLIGMVLGAYLGEESIPAQWLADLKKGHEIRSLLDQISA